MQNRSTPLKNPRVNAIRHIRIFAISSAIVLVLTLFATPTMQAQTFSVIHNFIGGADQGQAYSGVIVDRYGNLYGTTLTGGGPSCGNGLCGVVYMVSPAHTLSILYAFEGGSDGAIADWLTFGPDGMLYGITLEGGGEGCNGVGCGTVFRLQPPSHVCASTSCPWQETVLYRFQGQPDASAPWSLVFDSHGNLFGAAWAGGTYNWGAVFELTPSGSGWTEQVLYSFANGPDGGYPQSLLAIDSPGNLYGIATQGGQYGAGTIFELSPSVSGWTETTLFTFGASPATGINPAGGLILDSSHNLYGGTYSTIQGGPYGPGVVFELSPSGGGWTYHELYTLPGTTGEFAPLAMDSAGNLYGTTYASINSDPKGTVYELMPSGGNWRPTLLHEFSGGDGEYPQSGVSFDASGNLYGTTDLGGTNGYGVVWEITP